MKLTVNVARNTCFKSHIGVPFVNHFSATEKVAFATFF